jgi:hypothetical protein
MPYEYLIGKTDRKYNGKKIEDTNRGIIRHRSKKDRKYNGKMIEDTNGGIIRHRSKDPYDYFIGILYLFAIVFSVLL